MVVYFTPTIPNCTFVYMFWISHRQAAVIGLCIRVKLDRCLPRRLKSRVYITPGSHNTEESLNRQINDKERVAAALENPSLHILFVHLMLWLNENQGYWEVYCRHWFSRCGCVGQWISSILVSLIACLERNRSINDNHKLRLFSNDKKSHTKLFHLVLLLWYYIAAYT